MAFLGIRVPLETGRIIKRIEVPGEKETPSEYHITLLNFGKNWEISEICKSIEVISDIAAEVKPFPIKASKVSHFPKREDEPMAIIAPIESEELHGLHKELFKAFNDAEINFKKTFKQFRPHITLAYSEDEHDDFKIDSFEFIVSELVLWCGDQIDTRLFVTFPLKSPNKKNALLQLQADLFDKLAQNSF
jgi:2'-5' RNA ligase